MSREAARCGGFFLSEGGFHEFQARANRRKYFRLYLSGTQIRYGCLSADLFFKIQAERQSLRIWYRMRNHPSADAEIPAWSTVGFMKCSFPPCHPDIHFVFCICEAFIGLIGLTAGSLFKLLLYFCLIFVDAGDTVRTVRAAINHVTVHDLSFHLQ